MALSPDARAKIAEALADINVERGRGAQQQYVRDYAVQELLGKGGFGSVYQARKCSDALVPTRLSMNRTPRGARKQERQESIAFRPSIARS